MCLIIVATISIPFLLNRTLHVTASTVPPPVNRNPILTDVDVLIDVGHGGIDSGTLYGELYEKNINLEMAKLTYSLLSEKGYHVLMNRVEDYALSGENRWFRTRSRHLKDLSQRSHLANEVRPKAVISLHVNWAARSGKRGPVVLHQKSEASKRLAGSLQSSLNELYKTTEAPVYGKTFYLLKHVQVPAVIVEMGFISNPSDREQMTQPQKQKQLAASIAQGVIAFLNEKPAPKEPAWKWSRIVRPSSAK
ncbi:N-acetylmuramoyl-L-alanine amidase [Paenibacillus rigui]|uniref:N-acetylmuramoyl-L-alanine amidase n=2 Tax=Paenibacillus rigui TaxID=554312 RepID=A0A229UU48_9BACL|nr:N-acetylmuramoyl-L-alanine amidase [Paenibacillus rigui]